MPLQPEVIHHSPAAGAPTVHTPPLLFVHGAWHAAWCWEEHFLPYFAGLGYPTVALSLREHGASERPGRLRWTRIRDYVADVAQVAAALAAPPIVLGHSMGGFVLQHYLAQGHPAAGAVFLASVPPVWGAWLATLRAVRRHPIPFLQANLRLGLYPLVATPHLARDLLFSPDLPDHQVRAYHARLQDETYLGYLEMLGLALPDTRAIARHRLPTLVVGGTADRLFSDRDVHRLARSYNAEVALLPDLPHDLMLGPRWETAAARVARWLSERQAGARAAATR